jgi:hypothetical protein
MTNDLFCAFVIGATAVVLDDEMRPLALTDRQLDLLKRAVAALPEQLRQQFVADVAARLGSAPGNHALRRAINTCFARLTARGAQKETNPCDTDMMTTIS